MTVLLVGQLILISAQGNIYVQAKSPEDFYRMINFHALLVVVSGEILAMAAAKLASDMPLYVNPNSKLDQKALSSNRLIYLESLGVPRSYRWISQGVVAVFLLDTGLIISSVVMRNSNADNWRTMMCALLMHGMVLFGTFFTFALSRRMKFGWISKASTLGQKYQQKK
jgi:hypothetical protein